ncbi:unnamed protein product [Adineta ricciae]|uniref:Uncharacterized protein n=1 Tax=Adineta ricciae TaxID=249248 RepID=A0A815R8W7_ADIRI|nr:unnamed protein product [Adineta ricciae]CAF1472059.1 unnamed protein product [Adineta ricciae]
MVFDIQTGHARQVNDVSGGFDGPVSDNEILLKGSELIIVEDLYVELWLKLKIEDDGTGQMKNVKETIEFANKYFH